MAILDLNIANLNQQSMQTPSPPQEFPLDPVGRAQPKARFRGAGGRRVGGGGAGGRGAWAWRLQDVIFCARVVRLSDRSGTNACCKSNDRNSTATLLLPNSFQLLFFFFAEGKLVEGTEPRSVRQLQSIFFFNHRP